MIGLATLLTLLVTQSAQAAVEPGFAFFKVGSSDTQAGGHPDVEINFEVNQEGEGGGECGAQGCLAARVISIHWPAGFIGNPHVAPKCSLTEFNEARCPVDAQVGKFEIAFSGLGLYVPIYNMQTQPDQAGLLGFTAPFLNFPIFFELSARTNNDYGLDVATSPLARLPFNHFITDLWGVPANPIHNVDRFFTPLTGVGACYEGVFGPEIIGCPPGLPFVSSTYATPTFPEAPFLQNPTICGEQLTVKGDVEYYGGVEGHAEAPFPEMTGCQQASYNPSVVAKPTTSSTDTPSGMDIDVHVPQTQSPVTPSPSETKAAVIKLPPGFTINPNAADGKVACPEPLTAIGTLVAAECPEYSKVATLTLDVSALPEPIPGALYIMNPLPGDPYRVLLTANGFATHVKLPGSVRADPRTGQLSLVFENLPQAPLEDFSIHVFGSERGLFATPLKCGTTQVESEFIPWNNQLATRHTTSFMSFDSGPGGSVCPPGPRPFSPTLDAGSERTTAGAHAPFSVTLTREDGEQNLAGVTVSPPPGLSATLRGVSYCPEQAIERLISAGYSGAAEQASPACPANSLVGSAYAGVGAGVHPLYLPGKVYLAGPYRGAPLSLVVVLPAVSGPYDFGNVAVRAALRVNPQTAQVTAVSDPLPQILEGVPLRTRFIRINLDRPGFTLNPTNCEPSTVTSLLGGDEGGSATPTNSFQAADCAALSFAPGLSLRLTGGVNRLGHPAIHAVLTTRPGEADPRTITVTLPPGEELDNSHIGSVCSRVEFDKQTCPPGSLVGEASVTTPLLEQPLQGPVYLRSAASGLPDLALDLSGQIHVVAFGQISSVHGAYRASFQGIPDVPLGTVKLNLLGGSKGLLQNSEGLCGRRRRAAARLQGQDGALSTRLTKLQVPCGPSGHRPGAQHNKRTVSR